MQEAAIALVREVHRDHSRLAVRDHANATNHCHLHQCVQNRSLGNRMGCAPYCAGILGRL